MTQVYDVTRDHLEARRMHVLRQVGMSYNELAERAASYSLVADEWSAWEEIREIDFLLAADAE